MAALTTGFLAGCQTHPELAALCASAPISSFDGSFGSPLDSSPRDAAIAARFAPICKPLLRQDALDFGLGRVAYTCKVILPYDSEDQRAYQFEHVLGRRLSVKSFDPSTAEADDLRDPMRKRGATGQGGVERHTPIGSRSFSGGVSASLIILADSTGKANHILYTHRELSDALRAVRSLAGALELLELREMVGFMNSGAGDLGGRPPQCSAAEIVEDRDGWTIKGIDVRLNCSELRSRDLRVERSGQLTLLSDAKAGSLFSSYNCVD